MYKNKVPFELCTCSKKIYAIFEDKSLNFTLK